MKYKVDRYSLFINHNNHNINKKYLIKPILCLCIVFDLIYYQFNKIVNNYAKIKKLIRYSIAIYKKIIHL